MTARALHRAGAPFLLGYPANCGQLAPAKAKRQSSNRARLAFALALASLLPGCALFQKSQSRAVPDSLIAACVAGAGFAPGTAVSVQRKHVAGGLTARVVPSPDMDEPGAAMVNACIAQHLRNGTRPADAPRLVPTATPRPVVDDQVYGRSACSMSMIGGTGYVCAGG